MDMLDRFRGCLLGVAVGDALGMPTEGYTAQEIRSKFGPVRDMMPAPDGHFHTGLQAGQFTDDTEETLMLAEAMIEGYGFSADRFAEKLTAWGTAWTLDERLNRGVGFATRSAVESMIAGRSPLTEREADVLRAARDGAPVATLAHRLYLSEGTIRNRLSSAIGKTGASNRAEAVRIALAQGWL